MTVKRVTVSVSHTFELDIPDELLDESDAQNAWALDDFIYDAFMNEETEWDTIDVDW